MKLEQNLPSVNQNKQKSLTKTLVNKGFATNSRKISTAKKPIVYGRGHLHEFLCYFVALNTKDTGSVKICHDTIAKKHNYSDRHVRRTFALMEKDGWVTSSKPRTVNINGVTKTLPKNYYPTPKLRETFLKTYNHEISNYKKEKCPTLNINKKNNTIQKASLVILDPKKELEEFVLTDEIIKKVQDYFNISKRNVKNQFERFKKIYSIVNRYKDMTFHFMQFVHISIGHGWAKTRDYWQKRYFSTVLEKFDFNWDEKQKLIAEGIMQLDAEVAKIKDFIKERGLKYTAAKIKDAVLSIMRNKNWKGIERHVEIQHNSYISYGIIDKWLADRANSMPLERAPELSQEEKDKVRRISDEIEQRRLDKLKNDEDARKKVLQQLKELEASHPIYPGFCL